MSQIELHSKFVDIYCSLWLRYVHYSHSHTTNTCMSISLMDTSDEHALHEENVLA